MKYDPTTMVLLDQTSSALVPKDDLFVAAENDVTTICPFSPFTGLFAANHI